MLGVIPYTNCSAVVLAKWVFFCNSWKLNTASLVCMLKGSPSHQVGLVRWYKVKGGGGVKTSKTSPAKNGGKEITHGFWP